MSLAVVLLAAGHGTRMLSKKQKILHEVAGVPMVWHVFEAAQSVADTPPVLVIAPDEEGVPKLLGEQAVYVYQGQQLGTGHATQMAAAVLQGKTEQVLVTYGDMPLVRAGTIRQLADIQKKSNAIITLLTVYGEPTSSFGRIVRNPDGSVQEIVEVAEAKRRTTAEALLNIRELNVGIYCFDANWLWDQLPHLPLRQARNGVEYYLTDMVTLAREQGLKVEALPLADADEGLGAGTRAELVEVEKAFQRRINHYWLEHGVTLVDPATTYIQTHVQIGQDTILYPNSYLQGRTQIGQNCHIGANTVLRDAVVEDGCQIEQSVIEGVRVRAGTKLPPFSYLTTNNEL